MHGFNTMKYMHEVILPAIKEGADKADRSMADIDIVGGSFLITGKNEEEVEKAKMPVRQQLSFYASTRVYHPVLEVHGWQDVGQALFRVSVEGKLPGMAKAINGELMDDVEVIGMLDDPVQRIMRRGGGSVTSRVSGRSG